MVNVRRLSATIDERTNMTTRSGATVNHEIGYDGSPSTVTVTLPDDTSLLFIKGGVPIMDTCINPDELLAGDQQLTGYSIEADGKKLVVECPGAGPRNTSKFTLEEHEGHLEFVARSLLREVNKAIERNRNKAVPARV